MSLIRFIAWVVLPDFEGRIPAYFRIVVEAFRASGVNCGERIDSGLLS